MRVLHRGQGDVRCVGRLQGADPSGQVRGARAPSHPRRQQVGPGRQEGGDRAGGAGFGAVLGGPVRRDLRPQERERGEDLSRPGHGDHGGQGGASGTASHGGRFVRFGWQMLCSAMTLISVLCCGVNRYYFVKKNSLINMHG